MPVSIIQVITLREHSRPLMAIGCILPMVAGLLLGTSLLVRFGSAPWMKQGLGLFFLAVFAFQVAQRVRRKSDVQLPDLEAWDRYSMSALAFTMCAAGLTGGLFGVGGPPSMVLL